MAEENRHIESRVKSSFDSVQRKAPTGMWDKIDTGDMTFSDTEKIREGFDGTIKRAPSKTWDVVKRQLIIDDVWTKITVSLDKDDRKKAFWWWFGTAGVLLLISSIVFLNNPTGRSSVPKIAHTQPKKEHYDTTIIDMDNCIQYIIVNPLPLMSDSSAFTANTSEPASEQPDNIAETNDALEHSKDPRNTINSPLPNDSLVETGSMTDLPFREAWLIANSTHDSRLSENNKPAKPKLFDAGVIATVGNSWIFNNEVRSGINNKTLVSNDFSVGYGLGGYFSWRINRRMALGANVFIVSRLDQKYSCFEGGALVKEEIQLTRKKLDLEFSYFAPSRLLRSDVRLAGGLFASTVTTKQPEITLKSAEDQSEYQKYDAGLTLSFGINRSFNKFVVDYGIRSEWGLVNLNNGPLKHFDYTNSFYSGVYLKIGKRF
ncbi:MAG: hypothetical protein QE487_00510 [Fluviicola sp.]|nr:hypothetical protein [Fluviicola sp.]